MAAANVAVQLANVHGKKVLCIDWDLEAPGLHYYFGMKDKDFSEREGLVELLRKLVKERSVDLSDYVTKVKKIHGEDIKHGSLSMISCGKAVDSYFAKVASLDWDSFYGDFDGYEKIETLRRDIITRYDVCIIDARAGQSETNVVPNAQMPDAVAYLFSCSMQSSEGVFNVAKKVHAVRKGLNKNKNMHTIFVPSRVFSRESGYESFIDKEVEPLYQTAINDGYHQPLDQPNGLRQVVLELSPSASIGEQVTVFKNRADRLSLGYEDLAESILNFLDPVERLWRPGTGQRSDLDRVRSIREHLEDSALRGDDHSTANLQLQLAEALRAEERCDEARSLALGALSTYSSHHDYSNMALSRHILGLISYALQDYDNAIVHYNEALRLLPEELLVPQSVVSHNLGVVYRIVENVEKSRQYLTDALAFKQDHASPRDRAITYHQLGNLEFTIKDYDKAIEYFKSGIDLSNQEGDALGISLGYHQIGNVYAQSKDYKKALENFHLALESRRSERDSKGIAITSRRIGDIYSELGELKNAETTYREALSHASAVNDLRNQIQLRRRLSKILTDEGKIEEALEIIEASVQLARMRGFKRELASGLLSNARLLMTLRSDRFDVRSQAMLDEAAELATAPAVLDQINELRVQLEAAISDSADSTVVSPIGSE